MPASRYRFNRQKCALCWRIYGDGVADIDITESIALHRREGRLSLRTRAVAVLKPRFASLPPFGLPSLTQTQPCGCVVHFPKCVRRHRRRERECGPGFRDGLKVGRESFGLRCGEPRCSDTPHQFAPAKTGQAFTPKSLNTEITDKIIAELEAGRIPWVQLWGTAAIKAPLAIPRDAATQRGYRQMQGRMPE
jgi:hypothetical protein